MSNFKFKAIRHIIDRLKSEKSEEQSFDSHEFIEMYRSEYEHDYIVMLVDNMETGSNSSFRKTNSQIAAYLNRNAGKLGIEKVEKMDSKNDHGNNTANQVWRFLLVFAVVLISSFSMPAIAQEYGMTTKHEVVHYVADSSYVDNRIAILDELSECLERKCAPGIRQEEARKIYKDLYELCIQLSDNGLFPHRSEKKAFLSRMNKLVRSWRDTYVRSKDPLWNKTDTISTKIYCGMHDNYIYDIVPLKKIVRIEDCTNWDEIYRIDDQLMRKGYEWAWRTDKGIETIYFPVTYYSYPEHQNYAVIPILDDRKWVGKLIFSKEGNLIFAASDENHLDSVARSIANDVYLQDFKSNKYDIDSADELTKRHITNLLNPDYINELSRLQALQLYGALAKSFAVEMGRYDKADELDERFNEKTDKILEEYFRNRETKQYQQAENYVEQLKKDHEDEFHFGRRVRIDDTSYYISTVDSNGEAKHLIKVEYLQTAPFEATRKCTFIY